jgi:hypothetical protein
MLHKVSNIALRDQLALQATQCEKMLQDAMGQDLDAQPGIDCVVALYEAFEAAKRVPAAPTPPAGAGAGQPAPAISNTTLYWVAGVGALAIVFMSALSGD